MNIVYEYTLKNIRKREVLPDFKRTYCVTIQKTTQADNYEVYRTVFNILSYRDQLNIVCIEIAN